MRLRRRRRRRRHAMAVRRRRTRHRRLLPGGATGWHAGRPLAAAVASRAKQPGRRRRRIRVDERQPGAGFCRGMARGVRGRLPLFEYRPRRGATLHRGDDTPRLLGGLPLARGRRGDRRRRHAGAAAGGVRRLRLPPPPLTRTARPTRRLRGGEDEGQSRVIARTNWRRRGKNLRDASGRAIGRANRRRRGRSSSQDATVTRDRTDGLATMRSRFTRRKSQSTPATRFSRDGVKQIGRNLT